MYDDMFKKVLIVEDDLDFRNSLRDTLAAMGFAVTTADDGEQAIERLLNHRPNVVILDLLLPKVHGFEVLKKIRSYPDPDIAKTPVVIVSNLSSETDYDQAQTMGVSGYFVKNHLKMEELTGKIKEILFGSASAVTEEVWDFSK